MIETDKDSNLSKVTLDSTVDLPPMSVTVACRKLLSKPENMNWGIIEPDILQPRPLDGLLVGRSFIDIDAEKGYSPPIESNQSTKNKTRYKCCNF